jgi:lipoate-protein ligase A
MVLVLDPEPHAAAMNMALDEALLRLARTAALRVYGWREPAVSLGYFTKYAPVAAAWAGRAIVRRTTGGGVVPHGEDITYTLTMPISHPLARMNARESYEAVHAALARWLTRRGMASSLAGPAPGAGNGVCFESPVEADVLGAGRKLAGAAQRRTREGLLFQGSVQGVPREWAGELAGVFGVEERRMFTEEERELAERLVREKYGAREWTERV